jgi:hypothetical protein
MNLKSLIIIIVFFMTPTYSVNMDNNTTSVLPVNQTLDNSATRDYSNDIESGIFRAIGLFIGNRIIMPILMFLWSILMMMGSFIWVLLAPLVPWILGIIVIVIGIMAVAG